MLDEDTVFEKIDEITDELFRRLERSGIKGKTLTLKIKYKDFTLFTRSKTESQYLENKFSLSALAKQLWQSRPFDKPIRLLGLSLSNLNTEEKKQVSVQLKIPFPEFYNSITISIFVIIRYSVLFTVHLLFEKHQI